jgi:YD repeat-containing protein
VAKQTGYADGLGRPIKSITKDASGTSYSIVEQQYDPMGRAYKTSNSHNSTAQYWTTTQFDALGRPTITTLPDGNQTTFAYSAQFVTVTDPAGKQRKSQADGPGRLVSVYEPDPSSGQLTQQTSYNYTVLDALAGVAAPPQGGQTRTYNYDHLGRPTSVATPETANNSANYEYNDFDLLTQRTDVRGVITTYGYDTLNRLHQVSYDVSHAAGVPATSPVTYTYGTTSAQNNNGRMITMTDGVGSETYTYDILGRMTQLQKVISGMTYTSSYSYNLASELASLTYPSTRVVQQSYDAIGRLCAIAGQDLRVLVDDESLCQRLRLQHGIRGDRLQLRKRRHCRSRLLCRPFAVDQPCLYDGVPDAV